MAELQNSTEVPKATNSAGGPAIQQLGEFHLALLGGGDMIVFVG